MPTKMPSLEQKHSRSLPYFLQNALQQIPAGFKHISHKSLEPKTGEIALNSGNHAFFIGKLLRQKFLGEIAHLLGWDFLIQPESEQKTKNKPLYTESYLEGALDYLFAHLPKGERAYFYVGTALNELLNGVSFQEAYSAEEIQQKIYRIAHRKFQKNADDLIVIDLEKKPLHQKLFSALRANLDPATNTADVDKAMGGAEPVTLTSCSDSFALARYLYQAAQKDPVFWQILQKPLTPELRAESQKTPSIAFYPLIETAIKLAEILNGCSIHGGPNRQGRYDDIVRELIKGKQGKYRKNKHLSALFELLQGRNFETLHLDTDKNPFALKKEKIIAQCRLAVYGALAIAAGFAAFEQGRAYEERIQAELEAHLNASNHQELKETSFFFESKWKIPIENNASIFERLIKNISSDLQKRYRLSGKTIEEITPLIRQYLLQNKSKLDSATSNAHNRFDLVDSFCLQHKPFFEGKGIALSRPYAHLMPYLPDFLALIRSEKTMEIPISTQTLLTSQIFALNPQIKYLDTFLATVPGLNEFELYTYQQNGQTVLLADDYTKKHYPDLRVLSQAWAREGAQKFIDAQERYDTLPFWQYENLFMALVEPNYFDFSKKEWKIPDDRALLKKITPVYNDILGRFQYELAIYSHYENSSNTSADYLVAKFPNENIYTTLRAREAAKQFYAARYSHFNNPEYRYQYGQPPFSLQKAE